jgi:hypothetical protein
MPELERLVRVYARPDRYRREREHHAAVLRRLAKKAEDLRRALAQRTVVTTHFLAHVPEALAAIDKLADDVKLVLSWHAQPAGRPPDRDWKGLCLGTAEVLARARTIKITAASPQGHHPRGARLWRVLDVVSMEARGRPIQRRDVEEAHRLAHIRPGIEGAHCLGEPSRIVHGLCCPSAR